MAQKPFSTKRFKLAWETARTTADIAQEFGVSRHCVWKRAKAMGLPSRGHRPRRNIIPENIMATMLDMRAFGMSIGGIAKAVGVPSSIVQRQFEWRGLPRLPRERVAPKLAEYQQHKFAQAMAASAAQTRRAEQAIEKFNREHFPRNRTPKYLMLEAQA